MEESIMISNPAKINYSLTKTEVENAVKENSRKIFFFRDAGQLKIILDLKYFNNLSPFMLKVKELLVSRKLPTICALDFELEGSPYDIDNLTSYSGMSLCLPLDYGIYLEHYVELDSGTLKLRENFISVVGENISSARLDRLRRVTIKPSTSDKVSIEMQGMWETPDLSKTQILCPEYLYLDDRAKQDVLEALNYVGEISQHNKYSSRYSCNLSGWDYLASGQQSVLFRKENLVMRIKTNNTVVHIQKEAHSPYEIYVAALFGCLTNHRHSPKVYGVNGTVSVVEYIDIKFTGDNWNFPYEELKKVMLPLFEDLHKYGIRVEDLHLNNFGSTKDGWKVFDLDNWSFLNATTKVGSPEELMKDSKFMGGYEYTE
jgi:hypothetical protein